MTFQHTPVLLSEILSYLPDTTRNIIDFTLGGGNHSQAILRSRPQAFLYGIDRDPDALAAAKARLAEHSGRFELIHSSISEAIPKLIQNGVQADFILADLGVSSYQLDEQDRGFSLRKEGPLDMRMNPDDQETAADVVNRYSEHALTTIIRNYGEERFALRIAKNIVATRQVKPFVTTLDLTECVIRSIPMKFQFGKIHAATKTFQAIRIQVNKELDELNCLLERSLELLSSAGRLAVISFHSLEDRPVKQTFKKWEKPCTCPKEFPICTCGLKALIKPITRKAVKATKQEMEINLRSRSAKLRVIEKL